jgi:class 3 adenylate cyclase
MARFWHSLTYENIKSATNWFLDTANFQFSLSFDDLMMIMTFFVLFIGDITILAVDKDDDVAVEIVTTICLFAFIFELIASSWAKTIVSSFQPLIYEGYLFSFFFWLDIIAILSMLPDIPWIATDLGIGTLANDVGGTNSSFSQAARVVRTVRLVRLVRVYKITAERRRLKKINDELLILLEDGAISFEQMLAHQDTNKQNKQSKVGAELSDTTTRRVIVIVLAMLCLVPILSYTEPDNTQEASTQILHDFNLHSTSDAGRQLALDVFTTDYARYYNKFYLVRLQMTPLTSTGAGADDNWIISEEEKIDRLRESSITKFNYVSTVDGQTYRTTAWFNNYATQYNTAVGGIFLILFVTCVMLVATVTFTADAQRLVLDPIERMMAMVESVAQDPLRPLAFDHKEGSGEYETRLLETTIEKITGLLRIGFGEAGALIISENLHIDSENHRNNSSVINPLIPGVRVYAIFGFCDIHHFEEVNEKLGKEIMSFVNTVAAIVHSKVHSWAGQCNKNLGNAFLVVWRIGDAKSLSELLEANAVNDKGKASPSKKGRLTHLVKKKERDIDLTRVPGVDVLADRAVVAYLKIIAEINRSHAALAYRKDTRLTNDGKDEFKIRMGFGLHAGWAIEGAVGSLQKVGYI